MSTSPPSPGGSWWDRLLGRFGPEEVDPLEGLGLDEAWADAATEFHGALNALLQTQLEVVLRRGVPVRDVTRAPIAGTGRIHFADGTVLIARSDHAGDLTTLAMLALKHASVRLVWFHVAADGVATLKFTTGYPDDRELHVEAIGLDQAD